MSDASPPRPRRRRSPGSAFATLAATGVIGALLIVVLVVQLAQSGTVKNQLGDKVFDAGAAAGLAREVATPGPDGRSGPILLPALVGHRDIYLQHQGSDPNTGWSALDAVVPGEGRTCQLDWVASAMQFRDPCTGHDYPADGTGLPRYAVTVNANHHVIVDLRRSVP